MADFQFGRCSLGDRERVLRCDGRIVPLSPRAVELLRLLVSSPNTVLSKDELVRSLWPDSFVEEGNLTQTVFRVRRALEACDPTIRIETIPRRGYRIVVPGVAPQTSAPKERAWIAWTAAASSIALVATLLLATRPPPVDPTLIERGYAMWTNARSTSDVERSIGYFDEALRAAPQNAAAHAGLAYALVSLALRDTAQPQSGVDAHMAFVEARRAIELAPSLAAGHAALGQADAEFDDPRRAELELRRAVALDPRSLEARTWYGELLLADGRLDAARAQLEAAQALNSSWTEPGDNLALIAYLQRDYAQARAYADQSLVQAPGDGYASLVRALAESPSDRARAEAQLEHIERGRHEDALAVHALLAYLYAKDENPARAARELRIAQSLAGKYGVVSDPLTVVSFAGALASERKRDDAYAWLARLDRAERATYASDARLDSLRTDRRFAKWAHGV